MNQVDFKKRTKKFAIDIAGFCKSLPYDFIFKHYIAQLIRSSSSVGANYRAACRAKSKPDFINKLRIVEEEIDESMYFLELIYELNEDKRSEIKVLYGEGNQILSMIVGSINTARNNLDKSAIPNLKSKTNL